MEKKTKQELIEMVEKSASSIFNKSDVLNLLSMLETEKSIQDSSVEELKTILADTDYFVYLKEDTAKFSVSGNEIFLEDFQLDTDQLAEDILADMSYSETEEFKEDFIMDQPVVEKKEKRKGCGNPNCGCAAKNKKKKN